MQKVTSHLWFDKEAIEAAKFYRSAFNDAKITSVVTLHDTPSGNVDLVTIQLLGQEFMLISAGPLFKFNPSISFLVALDSKGQVDELWKRLSDGGAALIELGEYPFSARAKAV